MVAQTPRSFNRIDKLFVDRDGLLPDEAHDRRTSWQFTLHVGPEICASTSLQAAVITAARLGLKCFGRKTDAHFSCSVDEIPLLIPWSTGRTFGRAFAEAGGRPISSPSNLGLAVVAGTRENVDNGLQLTFDGWKAQVHPLGAGLRLPETEGCIVAGILSGALAVSEVFLRYADVVVDAFRRTVGLSLWRPDLPWTAIDGVGPAIEFLPADAWLLGLGHLGQAYLWCLSMLPYVDQRSVNLILNDPDVVEVANVDTGMLVEACDLGDFKASVSGCFLRNRGFRPRLIERAFQAGNTRVDSDPAVAFCGFDGSGPRNVLDTCGFDAVVESGLGGHAFDFDSILLHSFPNTVRTADSIWGTPRSNVTDEAVVLENPFYSAFAKQFGCGHMELAGKSVAVPFVGVTAATFAVGEVLRILHGGRRFTSIDLKLSDPEGISARDEGSAGGLPIRYQSAACPG